MEGGAHVVTSDRAAPRAHHPQPALQRRALHGGGRGPADGAPAGDGVRIEVSDTGIGIRAEDRQRIFEEFFQLGNPARTSVKGMGLGLSIVQRLCGLARLRARARSEYGRGSTFGFTVPRARPRNPARTAPQAPAHRADLSGRLVVAIDDEAAIVEGMRVLLAGWGVEVIASLTGDDVVEAVHAAGRMPDLIIADYRLGGGATGTQVIDRLRRELDPEIPAILVSGSMAPELVAGSRGEPLRVHAQARATGEAAGADRRCAWKNGAGKRS